MKNSAILYKFSGELVPEDVLNNCLLSSTAVGLAVATKDKAGKETLAVIRKHLKDLPDQMKQMVAWQEKLKTKDVTFGFTSPPEGTAEAQLQPFPVLFGTDNKPIAVAFVEGVSDPALTAKEDLVPLCQEAFSNAGMNLDKLFDHMKSSPMFTKAIASIGDENTHICIQLANDKNLFFGSSGAAGEENEWGWGTYSTAAEAAPGEPEQPAVQEPEEKSLEDELLEGLDASPAQEPAPTVNKPDGVHTTQAQTAKVNEHPRAKAAREKAEKERREQLLKKANEVERPDGGSADADYELVSPPTGMRENDVLRHMMKYMDKPIDNWKQLYKAGNLFFPVPKNQMTDQLKRWLKNTTSAKAVEATATATKSSTPAVSGPKGEIPGPKPGETTTPSADPQRDTPVLSPTEREEVIKNWLPGKTTTLLDVDSEAVMDPSLLAGFEDKYPNVFNQLGVPGWQGTVHWSLEDAIELAEKKPKACALAFLACRNELIKIHQKKYQSKSGATTTQTTTKVHPRVAARQQKTG